MNIQTPIETVLLREDEGGVVRLTLNRPKARNALSIGLMTALEEELAAHPRGPRRARGRRAGRRRPRLLRRPRPARDARASPAARPTSALFAQCSRADAGASSRLPKPVIAAVHGVATAAGCQLVATCDLAVAADDARVRDTRASISACSARRRWSRCSRNVGAQAGDGDAADRRTDRRRPGARVGPRQPRGAGRRAATTRSTAMAAPDRRQVAADASRSARRRSIASSRWTSPTPTTMPPRS